MKSYLYRPGHRDQRGYLLSPCWEKVMGPGQPNPWCLSCCLLCGTGGLDSAEAEWVTLVRLGIPSPRHIQWLDKSSYRQNCLKMQAGGVGDRLPSFQSMCGSMAQPYLSRRLLQWQCFLNVLSSASHWECAMTESWNTVNETGQVKS